MADEQSIPVAEETVRVEKQAHESGQVVVHVVPGKEVLTVEVPVTTETVEVERVAVNRIVEKTEGVRQEGEITVVPVYEEVLVVEKKIMLREEIRLIRRRETVKEHKEVEVRRESAEILRANPRD